MSNFKTGDRVFLTDREGYHEGVIREETRYRGSAGETIFHFTGETLCCTAVAAQLAHVA